MANERSFFNLRRASLPPSWTSGLVPSSVNLWRVLDVRREASLSLEAGPRRSISVVDSWCISLVIERLLVVLQVGPLLVLGTLAFQVLVLFGGALVSSCSGGGRSVSFVSSGARCGVCCVIVLGVFSRGLRQCLSRTHGTRSRGVQYNVRLCTARVWFRTQGVARFSPSSSPVRSTYLPEVLHHFCFAWATTPRKISDPHRRHFWCDAPARCRHCHVPK